MDIVYNNVFKNYDKLNPYAKIFYQENLHLFIQGDNAGEKWDDLMKSGSFDTTNNNYTNYKRLNLVKEKPGSNLTKFGSTLPFLPVCSKNIYYTDENGTIQHIEFESDKFYPDTLREIYRKVYLAEYVEEEEEEEGGNKCIEINGHLMNLPKNFNDVKNRNKDFDIDYTKIIHGIIKKSYEKQEQQEKDDDDDYNVLDIFEVEDLTTKIIYGRDQDGRIYKKEGNVKTYEDQTKYGLDDCLGSGLKPGNTLEDKNKCASNVVNCLARGDAIDLLSVVDILRDSDFFMLAQKDLIIRPSLALKILQTFRIGETVENGLKVPISFETWKNSVLPKLSKIDTLTNVILGNENLVLYLKGVIEFVRKHPGLLNKDFDENKKISLSKKK